MFYVKEFFTKYNFLVAICDKELVGKNIKDKELKVKVSRKFYQGELVDEKKCIELMKKATIGNLIGKKIIKLALREGFIEEENIMYIGKVPHAQFIKL